LRERAVHVPKGAVGGEGPEGSVGVNCCDLQYPKRKRSGVAGHSSSVRRRCHWQAATAVAGRLRLANGGNLRGEVCRFVFAKIRKTSSFYRRGDPSNARFHDAG
jgi:hypothetical protein